MEAAPDECGRSCPERISAVWDDRLRGVSCGTCSTLEQEELMVVCDRCEVPHHRECVEVDAPVGRGPWYCPLCRGWLLTRGHSDPVQDVSLLDYLFRGRIPDDEVEYTRVRRLG
jgi:hypothetical protein